MSDDQQNVTPRTTLDQGSGVGKELSEAVRGSGSVVLPTEPAQGINPVMHMSPAEPAPAQTAPAGPQNAAPAGATSSNE
jgi:hypothetical protein